MGIVRKGYQAMFESNKWMILRGDKVHITAGKDKGQVGTVLKVIRDAKFPRVIVEGLNLTKRHVKRTKENPGGIISVESPLHYSNVALVDPVTNAPVRVCTRWLEDGTKVRISKGRLASGSIIPRPDVLKQRRKPLPVKVGKDDTAVEEAAKLTHKPGDLPSFLKVQLSSPSVSAAVAGPAQQQQRRRFSSSGSTSSSELRAAVARLAAASGGALPWSRQRFWRGFAASML